MKNKFVVAMLLLVMLCGLSFGQQRTNVLDLGDGYMMQGYVAADGEKAILVRFPDATLVSAEAYEEAMGVAIYKVFVPEFLNDTDKITVKVMDSPTGGKILYFDLPRNPVRIYIYSLSEEGSNKIVGVVFVAGDLPPNYL